MAGSQQIDLLFGVKGGGNPSGASGARIQGQINSIVGGIKPIEIKVNYTALLRVHKQLEQLSAQIDAINAKPLKIAAGGNAIFNIKNSGGVLSEAETLYKQIQRISSGLPAAEARVAGFNKQLAQTKIVASDLTRVKSLIGPLLNKQGTLISFSGAKTHLDEMRNIVGAYGQYIKHVKAAATANKHHNLAIKNADANLRAMYSSLKSNVNSLGRNKTKLLNMDDTIPEVKQAKTLIASLEAEVVKFKTTAGTVKPINFFGNNLANSNAMKAFLSSSDLQKLPAAMAAATKANKSYGKSVVSLETQIKKAQRLINNFGSKKAKLFSLDKELAETKEYKRVLIELQNLAKGFTMRGKVIPAVNMGAQEVAKLKQYLQLYDLLPAKINAANAATRKLKISANEHLSASKMLNQVWGSFNKFPGIDRFQDIKKDYVSLINELTNKTRLNNKEAALYARRLKDIENRAYDAGAGMRSFTQSLNAKLLEEVRHLISSFATMFVIQGFRTLYRNVLEIDTAMTELKKVTELTSKEYVEFLDGASERAKNLGASLKEVINATADYSRMGFSLADATKLADSAIVYQNVGDGLQDIDEATSHLISTMTAFGYTASDSMHIVDIFNEVANNYAVTAADIGTGIKKSAASMQAAGNSLEETVALFTTANTIARDADVVGTALKTVSMRLRSTKIEMEEAGEDTEGMASTVSNLREQLLALTGVDIQLDDGTYKSTYQMLKEISEVWDELSDKDQAAITEKLFGKKQGNIGLAILENFELADEVLATALDSSGSALEENEKYLESIQGHLDQLSASFQTFAQNFLDSEFVKTVIDLLRGILDFFNEIIVTGEKVAGTFGQTTGAVISLTMALITLDTVFGFKHVQGAIKSLKTLKIALQAIIGKKAFANFQVFQKFANSNGLILSKTESKALLGRINGVKKALSGLFKFIKGNPLVTGAIGAVAAVTIGAVVAGTKAVQEISIENQLEDIKEAKDAYDIATRELEEYNSQLETNISRLKELYAIPSNDRTLVEQEELNKLERENELLEANIAIKEREQELARQEIVKETKDAFQNTMGYSVNSFTRDYGRKDIFNWFGLTSSISQTSGYDNYDADGDGKSDALGSSYLGSYMHLMQQIESYDAKILEISEKLGEDLTDSQRKKYERELARYEEFKNDAVTQTTEMRANLLQWRNDLADLADEGDTEAIAMVAAIENAIYGITSKEDKVTRLLGDSRFAQLFEYIKKFGDNKDLSLENLVKSDFVLGNIDLKNRQVIEWTEETLKTYKDAIESWGLDPSELEGTVSDVLGTSGEYEGIEIAFSPILQTQNGPKLLSQDTVDQYMFGLIDAAKKKYGDKFTIENLIELDAQGIGFKTEDGEEIKGLLASVGEGASKVAEAMHYLSTEVGAIGRTIVTALVAIMDAFNIDTSEIKKALDATENEIAEDPPEVPITVSTEDLDKAKEAIEGLTSSCKSMADAFKEQNENGSLSVDTILDVIEAGYGAALAIDQATGEVKLNADMYVVLASAELLEAQQKWENIKASYEAALAQYEEAKAAGTLAAVYGSLEEAEKAAAAAKKGITDANAILAAFAKIDLSNITAGLYGVANAAKDVKSQLSNLQSGMESLLSQTISWLKQEYSDAQEAQEKLYDSQIDSLEKAKDAAKERWDAEKEALEDVKDSYNDIIDAQIELLKRQKDADDYAKSRAEKEKAVSDIEAQLLAIQDDDSIEAQKMRLELEEQLKEAQDELDELQSDREYELREQALQDEKDRYNDEIDAKIEAIEKQSEAEEKAYQERIDRLQDYLDAVRDAEKTEAQWRAEAYDWIENREEELYQKLLEWNQIYGDGRKSTVDQWFAEAEGWEAWGNSFEEARNNLAQYLYELAEAAGVVAETTTALLEDVLKQLDIYKQGLLDQGLETEATMVENLIENISNAVANGIELSDDMLKAMQDAIISGDIECLEATNKMLEYYNEVMSTGRTNFAEMAYYFRQAMLNMDEDAFIILQGIMDNICAVSQEAYNLMNGLGSGGNPAAGGGNPNLMGEKVLLYSEGGIVDYTGPAVVHGSASRPEIVFNADQAAKLYDYVVNTPNLLKSAFDSIMVESPKLRADPIGMNPTVGDININISGNADADTVNSFRKIAGQIREEVVRSLNESMSRRGIARSPRMV